MTSPAAFSRRMRGARACLHAYGAIAEYHFAESPNDFSFTFKLHQATAHMADMAILSGHPAFDNDLWVERMVRLDAAKKTKYALLLVIGI